jgi:hypothetical protein
MIKIMHVENLDARESEGACSRHTNGRGRARPSCAFLASRGLVVVGSFAAIMSGFQKLNARRNTSAAARQRITFTSQEQP